MTAPSTVTLWPTLRTPEGGVKVFESWDHLFARFSERFTFLGQDHHPGWSPAKFDPCVRSRDNVREVYALCLDYDGGEPIETAIETWSGFYGFIHTSRRHTPEEHRYRVILPLSRAVSPFEFSALWIRFASRAGGKVDPAPKDPSRFWFAPGVVGNAEYRTHRLDGDPVDADEWLAMPDPTPQRRAPLPAYRPQTDVEDRAIKYIDRMPAAIAGSGGHDATWRVALVLARGFALGEDATLRILRQNYNPRCEPPWSERELEHKARSAANDGRVETGWLLREERPWEPGHALPSAPSPDPEDADQDVAPHEEPAQDTRTAAERYGLISMRGLMQDVADELAKPRPRAGIPTGNRELDEAIGGFRCGNVTVFGAKRGFGKTSYGNMVTDLALPERRVAMFAGEDAAAIYGKRFLAMKANLNAMRLRDYRVNEEDWPRIRLAIEDAPDTRFFTRVEGRPVEWIAEAIRALGKEEPLDLVIVDYLQCIRPARKLQDRRNEVTYVCKTLSDAIKSVNAAGLIFSQLKRTERVEPEVEDLKESGDIEDMADHILLGWKVDATNDAPARRMLKLAKNKDGTEASEVSAVTMQWDNRTANFRSTSWEEGPTW